MTYKLNTRAKEMRVELRKDGMDIGFGTRGVSETEERHYVISGVWAMDIGRNRPIGQVVDMSAVVEGIFFATKRM